MDTKQLKKLYENPVDFLERFYNVKLSFWQRQILKLYERRKN